MPSRVDSLLDKEVHVVIIFSIWSLKVLLLQIFTFLKVYIFADEMQWVTSLFG